MRPMSVPRRSGSPQRHGARAQGASSHRGRALPDLRAAYEGDPEAGRAGKRPAGLSPLGAAGAEIGGNAPVRALPFSRVRSSRRRGRRVAPRMKPQPVVTNAFFPTALAVASISLAILLLPAGGSPMGSSGLAPALRLVAGDVVTAVKAPVTTRAKARPKTILHRAVRSASTPVPTQGAAVTSSARGAVAPAHRAVHHAAVRRSPAPHKRAAGRAPRATHAAAPAAPAPVAHGKGRGIGHERGKGKALGRLRKTTLSPAPASHGKGHAYANGHGVELHGAAASVRHGAPAAVPSGLARGGASGAQGTWHGRGGGK